jgi:DNA-binding transcriptional MocR family regulator
MYLGTSIDRYYFLLISSYNTFLTQVNVHRNTRNIWHTVNCRAKGGGMEIDLRRNGDIPLYRQLHAAISERIRSGKLSAGARLPSVRNLAKELGVSLITVVQAYDALAVDGLAYAAVGRGTFVGLAQSSLPATPKAENGHAQRASGESDWQASLPVYLRAPRISAMQAMLRPVLRSEFISLAAGTPDPTLFPLRALGRLWHRAMALEDPRFLQYGTPQGDHNLRSWIAAYCGTIGIGARPEDVLITSGSQQAIDLVARTFVGPGDYVLVESPTFLTALDIFEGRGAKLLGVPLDADGARMDVAAALIERFHPRLVYTIPTAQNPTGTTMTEERRRRLAALARQYNFIVLEDDICSDFAYEGEPPHAIKSHDTAGHVVFIKSFSKTVIPGLRVGCVVAHSALLARLIEAKSLVDRFTSPLIQRTLWRYLSTPQYLRDLDKARDTYRRRRDAVLRALQEYMPGGVTWTRPDAGFNLWIGLPDTVSAAEAFEEGLREGVACGVGDLFLPHTPPPSGVRISFADVPEAVLTEGIRRLSRGITRLLERRPPRLDEPQFVTAM